MNKLNFLSSGIPLSTSKKGLIEGLNQVKKLDLDGMELEFVHGIYLKKEKTPEIKKFVKENNLIISSHSPYYVNLNAQDKQKWHASISYIVKVQK